MSRWNIIKNITAEIGRNKSVPPKPYRSQNIEKFDIAVLLGITQYELVPAPESAGTARCISA